MEWKQRGLDRERHQGPDRDRYISDEEGTVVDNDADEHELIAVSNPYQYGAICVGSNTFEEDMLCQVDGRCSCSGDNERAIKRGKDVSESQIPAVGSTKGSTK